MNRKIPKNSETLAKLFYRYIFLLGGVIFDVFKI